MWRIGIDEAGYGPNFGPLVMSAVACRVPDGYAAADMWQVLRPVVGRTGRAEAAHLFVDDSKKVYQSGKGLAGLERTVHAFLECRSRPPCRTLAELIAALSVEPTTIDEPWYHGGTPLPNAAKRDAIERGADGLGRTLEREAIEWGPIYCAVIDTPRFNGFVDRWGSKGAALAVGFVTLLRACLAQTPAEDGVVVVDKHGGRNRYGAILQELSADAWVVPVSEGMSSTYEVRWPERSVRVTFRPEADATSFEVALASMVSKYVRELCMGEFNAFWKSHVPDVKPTAGYPVDALRFLKDIQPTLDRMNLALDRVWRKR